MFFPTNSQSHAQLQALLPSSVQASQYIWSAGSSNCWKLLGRCGLSYLKSNFMHGAGLCVGMSMIGVQSVQYANKVALFGLQAHNIAGECRAAATLQMSTTELEDLASMLQLPLAQQSHCLCNTIWLSTLGYL